MCFRVLNIMMLLMVLCSCDFKFIKPLELNYDTATEYLDNLSPVDGAKFYTDLRNDNPCLDTIYYEEIVPALCDVSYFELKQILNICKETPVYEEILPIFNEARDEILEDVQEEVLSNANSCFDAFVSSVMPIIEVEVDSMIEHDYQELFGKYDEGLNLFSANQDIRSLWNQHVNAENYRSMINNYIDMYMGTVHDLYSDYYKSLTGRTLTISFESINLPKVYVPFPDAIMKDAERYADKKTSDEIKNIAEGAISGALAYFSGGASLAFDIATISKDVYDEITNTEISPEFAMEEMSINYVCNSITNEYLNSSVEIVRTAMEKDLILLWNQIEKEL